MLDVLLVIMFTGLLVLTGWTIIDLIDDWQSFKRDRGGK